MTQLAINVSLSKAKANYVMSSEVETFRELSYRLATRFLDFALNDIMKISGKFRTRVSK